MIQTLQVTLQTSHHDAVMLKIHVQNFQSIADAEIEIEGFTVVTGSNNSGKTAVMRAVRGVLQNTSGHRFVRHGEDKCVVTLSDGTHTVQWEKGAKHKPKYTIDGAVLYPGRDVPTELGCLNIVPIKCSGREIWPQLAPQFQQIFLLDETGSSVAEALADVERVGKLNRALKKANTDRKSVSSELKVRNKDKLQYEKDLLEFEGFDDVISQFEIIEEQYAQLQQTKDTIEQLQALQDEYEQCNGLVQSLEGVSNIVLPDRSVLVGLAAQAKECRSVSQLCEQYEQTTQEIADVEAVLQLIVLPSKEQLTQVNTIRKQIKSLYDLQTQHEEEVNNIEDLQASIKDVEREYCEAKKEVNRLLEEAKVCPICGSQCGVHFMDQIFQGDT